MPGNKQRSITQLLRKNYSAEKKREITLAWVVSWTEDQTNCIKRLGLAVKDDNYDELCISVGQLKELSAKRLSALPKVIDAIFDIEKISSEYAAKKLEHENNE